MCIRDSYGINPIIRFTDTNHNPDYAIHGSAGVFLIEDTTNTVNRLRIDPSDGHFDIIGDFNIANDLDVDGHTNLDNVNIAGVTTFAGNVDINADIDVDGHTNLDNVSVAGVSTFAGAIDLNADLDVSGTIKGYDYLVAPHGGTTTITVTVANKTSAHRYHGQGSNSGYVFDLSLIHI